MKFSCTKENLSQTIGLVGNVATKHVNLPILSNILIRADQQKVEFAATNLELAVTATLRAKVEEPGVFTIPARTLADVVHLLRDEKVDLELKDQELHLISGKSSTKIKGTPAEEFPIIPTVTGGKLFAFSRSLLKESLAQVSPAVAKNDIRPELSGVFCGFNARGKKGLTLAATDSYRLAEKLIEIEQGDEEETRLILPGKTVQELIRVLSQTTDETIRLVITENQINVSIGGVELLSRLVEGVYPDYTQIIPREFTSTATVSTDHIVKEIKAAGLFTTTGVNAVELELDPATQSVRVSSASTQTGEYRSEVPAELTGGAVKVLLSHRYLLDGLNTISTNKTMLNIVGPDSPCIITPEGGSNFLYIVMPIRQ